MTNLAYPSKRLLFILCTCVIATQLCVISTCNLRQIRVLMCAYVLRVCCSCVCVCVLVKVVSRLVCQQSILQQPGGLLVCHYPHGNQSCFHNNGSVVMETTGCHTNHHLYECSQKSTKSSMGGYTTPESEKRPKPREWQTLHFLKMCVFSKYKYTKCPRASGVSTPPEWSRNSSHGKHPTYLKITDVDRQTECAPCGAECESVVHVLWECSACSSIRVTFVEKLRELLGDIRILGGFPRGRRVSMEGQNPPLPPLT